MFKKMVAVSGGFDPVHVGHLRMFEAAKQLGNHLTVIVNNDDWVNRKKGDCFMSAVERAEIIKGFHCVDRVIIQRYARDDVCEELRELKPDIFANGGDRKSCQDIPERAVCEVLGIAMIFHVGGGKIQSSSKLHKNYKPTKK